MQDNTRRIIHRKDLYRLVWKRPLVKLAEEFQVSDVMLGKICRKLCVPTPPVGYWAKLAAGQKLEKPRLPKIGKNHPVTHLFTIKHSYENSNRPKKEEIVPFELQKVIDFEKNKTNKIVVSNKRGRPHRLIAILRKQMESNSTDSYGRVYSYNLKGITVGVSPSQVKRVLNILNVFLQALESRGYLKINIESDSTYAWIEVFSNKMDIMLYEPAKKIKLKLPKKSRPFYLSHKYDYIPSGEIQFQVRKHGSDYVEKAWSDTTTSKLEDKLNRLIIGLAKVSVILTEQKIRWENWQREQEELNRKREEVILQEQLRRKQEEELLNHARMWQNYQLLKEFIDAVKSDLESEKIPEKNRDNVQNWIAWACGNLEKLTLVKGCMRVQ